MPASRPYGLLNNGSEIGIQAKYFLRVRDIDWRRSTKRRVYQLIVQETGVPLYIWSYILRWMLSLTCEPYANKGGGPRSAPAVR